MRLRTFTATDMPAALKIVRDTLGDSAIILSTESHKGKKGISVTAAIGEDDDIEHSKKRPLPAASALPKNSQEPTRGESYVDQLRFEMQNILRFHNLPEHFISKILQKASDAMLSPIVSLHKISGNINEMPLHRQALEKLIEASFSFNPLLFDRGKTQLMLVGPPGIGKTLTIAKIAALLTMGKQPHQQQNPWLTVITTDNKRAGGVEQLQAFTSILGLQLQVAPSHAELSSYLKSLPQNMQVLIDTAGCNPYDHKEIQELKAFAKQSGIEPVLVLPAGGDSLETIDIVEAFMALSIKRLMITRADTTRRFGGVLSAAAAHGLTFCNVSSSSSIIDTLQPLDGGAIAQMLLRYQLQYR